MLILDPFSGAHYHKHQLIGPPPGDISYQSLPQGGPLGPCRRTQINFTNVAGQNYDQPCQIDIIADPGILIVDTGFGATSALNLLYGNGSAPPGVVVVPLSLDLSNYSAFHLKFEGLATGSGPATMDISVWMPSGNWGCPQQVPGMGNPFTVNFPFSKFAAPPFSDITEINIVVEGEYATFGLISFGAS